MRATPLISAGLAILASLCAPARADDIPPCAAPKGVEVAPLAAAPQAVQQALFQETGKMAAPGEAFDATDVITTRIHRRLIFIWHAGARWVVATERGGFTYNDPVFSFVLGADGKSAVHTDTSFAIPNTVCTVAKILIASPPAKR